MSVLFITDDIFLQHETGDHPECKARLQAIYEMIKTPEVSEKLICKKPRAATSDELRLNHTDDYILHVQHTIEAGTGYLDADTVVSEKSLEAAYKAAGAGLVAADMIMQGEIKRAFCAVRPPGHHAEHDAAMGFCLFNNIAITARYIQEKHNLEKIFIIDWDVHHGNGTQHSFYDNNTIYYLSLHQYPHFPGTGAKEEIGTGKGKGYTKNLPMQPGYGNYEYQSAFKQEVIPAIKNFAPDIILISAGFDAHERDPLSRINLTSKMFGEFTDMLKSATDSNEGRIISFLEGGYDLRALSDSMRVHLLSLSK